MNNLNNNAPQIDTTLEILMALMIARFGVRMQLENEGFMLQENGFYLIL
jgi:hypothetical protein